MTRRAQEGQRGRENDKESAGRTIRVRYIVLRQPVQVNLENSILK